MKVTLLAYTALHRGNLDEHTPYVDQFDASDADTLAEFAGRNCYRSWGRPNPATSTNEGYLANIIAKGHESVLEHASVSFYVEGVSRSLLAELSRHRHLSFSVVSQRYVHADELGEVEPPLFRSLEDPVDREVVEDVSGEVHDVTRRAYRTLTAVFEQAGYSRKVAREAARSVLPQSTESPMVVSGNLRAWRDVLRKRYHVAADAEIQEFAGRVLEHLRRVAPNSFQDVPAVPFR